ncbi:hypothetical protein AVEN_149207-1 [Araneus ventricosus]|uniref:Uncharacterized protein n=1 Tax=Araneus ventricosus TaxID=182803 RepID=A0A4Y2IKJ0_ARAVE|nr:hypothetical protein AVEN_149207-1 [Araneus ventricosus]
MISKSVLKVYRVKWFENAEGCSDLTVDFRAICEDGKVDVWTILIPLHYGYGAWMNPSGLVPFCQVALEIVPLEAEVKKLVLYSV